MNYLPPSRENWQGRKTGPSEGKQYWYQHVALADVNVFDFKKSPDFGIVGYACDIGVALNQGRIGAKYGPKAIRKKAGRMALHTNRTVIDFGDAMCEKEDISWCQNQFSTIISALLENGCFPIALGGGHDMALAHFNGIKEAFPDRKIGIINFDAHFDLRPVLNGLANSGTPFNQILSKYPDLTDYMAIGIQQSANTQELFQLSKTYGAKHIPLENCEPHLFTFIEKSIQDFIRVQDVIYITVDLDGFSSAYAPGVSAPSAIGFSPSFIMSCLQAIFQSGKVVSLDIAEMNPIYDRDEVTAGLAASILEYVTRKAR